MNAPRRGSMRARPPCSRRAIASPAGVRPTPNLRARAGSSGGGAGGGGGAPAARSAPAAAPAATTAPANQPASAPPATSNKPSGALAGTKLLVLAGNSFVPAQDKLVDDMVAALGQSTGMDAKVD